MWYPPAKGVLFYPDPADDPTNFYKTNTDYGPIPTALAVLQPRGIKFNRLKPLPGPEDDSPAAVVHIWILGGHSSGHASRWFGLEVLCGPNIDRYTPRRGRDEFYGSCHPSYTRVADGVYEVAW